MGEREGIVVKALSLLRSRENNTSTYGGLAQLAEDVGVTPGYLCRVFKKTMGMTLGKRIEEFERPLSANESSAFDIPLVGLNVHVMIDSVSQLATPTLDLATDTSSADML